MKTYRDRINKDAGVGHISNSDLDTAIRQVVRDMIYDHLIFGKDITYCVFIKNLEIYLNMVDRIS